MAELTTEVPIPRDVPTTPEEPVISTAPKKDHTRSVALAVGAVIGSAPEIARGVSKSTELLTKIDPRNILALGDHCLPREYNQVLGAFDNDDPNVNVWYPSPELRHRLIADQPEVLTVDGITLPLDYGTYDKKSTWLGLPARPARLNPSKKQIFAIAADKIYADLSTDPTLTHKLVFQEGQDIEQAYTDMDPQARDKRNFIEGTSIGVSAALVVLTTLINKYIDQQTEEGKPATAAASKVSRRAILGSILGASALYGVHRATKVFRSLGVNAALPQEVRAPQEKDAALWQNVITYLDAIPENVWGDGRTALMIAKHEDGMDFLREKNAIDEKAKGAIVMGETHAGKAGIYMHDKDERDKAILAYAKHIVTIADTIAGEQYHFSDEKKTEFTKGILDNLVRMNVVKITDPDETPKEPLLWYVQKNQDIAFPHIVSKQVENAIKSLRM